MIFKIIYRNQYFKTFNSSDSWGEICMKYNHKEAFLKIFEEFYSQLNKKIIDLTFGT